VFCDRVTLHAPQDAARMSLMYFHHPPTSVLVVPQSFTSSLRHLIDAVIRLPAQSIISTNDHLLTAPQTFQSNNQHA
jgi:hypothetical protein